MFYKTFKNNIYGQGKSDYLYLDDKTNLWVSGNTKVSIGRDFGYTNQQDNTVAIGSSAVIPTKESNL